MKPAINKLNIQYQLQEQVGRGGLGQVYRATQKATGQTVAVKVLNPEVQSDHELIGIFQKEMMMLMKLSHPNLVGLVDYCSEPPAYFLATDFVDGLSIHDMLQKFWRLPPLVAASICIQVFAALDHIHLRDLIHADLSAGNILIRKDGRVLVTDLGLASDVLCDRYRYEIVGTAGYYSPEHVIAAPIGPQSDLYCVGLLFFEMLTGRKAILPAKSTEKSREIAESMRQINFEDIRCLDHKLEEVCRKLATLMLQWKLSQRVRDSEDAFCAFRQLLLMFGITDPESCIHQFLVDGQLVEQKPKHVYQDIYFGNFPYTSDDIPNKNRA
ncbi:MAG: serine/threonine protein kinase [Oligoflexus sp.]